IFAGNDFAVVLLNGLPRPANAFGFLGQVHIYETHLFFVEKQLQYFVDEWLDRRKVSFFIAHGGTECDAAQAEECGLLRGRQGARMPASAAQVWTEIDSRENQIHAFP